MNKDTRPAWVTQQLLDIARLNAKEKKVEKVFIKPIKHSEGKERKTVNVITNQYFDWIYCRIRSIEEVITYSLETVICEKEKSVRNFLEIFLSNIISIVFPKKFLKHKCGEEIVIKVSKDKPICNFLKIFFDDIPPIVFPKKFLEHKGIKTEDISIEKILYIQPKVRGKIMGTHMIHDLELKDAKPKIWKDLKISSVISNRRDSRLELLVFFEDGLRYVFEKKFLDYKGVKIEKGKTIKVKEKGGWIYDIK